jgi:hypothetical protein
MKGYGYPADWVSKRTTLEEAPAMSKAVRRYGVNGSRLDSTHGSTGGHEAHESDIAPSIAPRHVGRIGEARTEVVGHAPDGSGKWLSPTHDRELIGNAIQTHEPLKPQGQMKSANSKFGKVSKVPAGKDESYRRRAPGAVLNGDSDPHQRPEYSGGKGRITP